MSETVIILGAGASRLAGAPLMNDFLDVADAIRKNSGAKDEDFERVFIAKDALQAVHSKAQMDLLNLESVFAAFEMAKLLGRLGSLPINETDSLPNSMRRLIYKTLQATVKFPVRNERIYPPRPYDELAKALAAIWSANSVRALKTSFITFNYDVCLDYALAFQGLPIDYSLGPFKGSGFKVLKLHGSLNWSQCEKCKGIVPLAVGLYVNSSRFVLLDLKEITFDFSRGLAGLKCCNENLKPDPFIAPPTWNKTQYHSQLAGVWRAAAQELSGAENIIVCGYSLPETDQFFRYLYALGSVGGANLKRFWVIDRDSRVVGRFKDLCGPQASARFQFLEEPFDQAIPEIAGILK
ncbi:MAG: hypothetical protein WAM91_16085 [Candidatus Acidiferrales bacterium]